MSQPKGNKRGPYKKKSPVPGQPPMSQGTPSVTPPPAGTFVPPPFDPIQKNPIGDMNFNALPPLPLPGGGAPPLPGGIPSPVLIDPKQARAFGQIADNYFSGITTALNLAMPKTLELSIEKLDEGEQELLGTFIIPVINKYLPKFQDSPEYALAVVACGLYLGKIKVKKKIVVNLGNAPEAKPEPVPEPVIVKERGLNLGNAEEVLK